MIEKNEMESVWFIENNKLHNKNRVVSKIMYDGVEIAVTKSRKNWVYPDLLIKDKDNKYWEFGTLPIIFDILKRADSYKTMPEVKEYCDSVKNIYKNLEKLFENKIANNKYFNICELAYISKYHTNLYEKAKLSRTNFLQEREKEKQKERMRIEKAENEEMDIVNEIFENKITEMKTKIHLGDVVVSEDYDYYKERNYYGGKVTQNNFLYLAKQYGIDIPLATKGFINNKLDSYNFGNGDYITRNYTRGSTKIRECFEKIKDKVDEEYQKNKKHTKEKIKNKDVLGGDK